jgi:hypothetical protein
MLSPSKHSDPDQTVLAASTTLLRALRKKRIVSFDELKASLMANSQSPETLFLPAVNFIYLVGLVEYRAVVDSFEYVGE